MMIQPILFLNKMFFYKDVLCHTLVLLANVKKMIKQII